MAVVELGYFTIGVADVARAMKFYGALFGWEFSDTSEAYAHVSNTVLPFGLKKDAPADLSSFYFRVDDMAAMVAKVKTLGGAPGEIQDYPSGLNAVCKDDQGATFSLWQPASGY
ncbi:MAG TPA: VOC family protein [Rhizomicrobium sp.]|jgi:predicted enzyme related to lactoylglutathione lyase